MLDLSAAQAIAYVREALDENRLAVTTHAKERMAERNISMTQIRTVLRQAFIQEGPLQDTSGRWSCRFEGYSAGQGIAVVVGFSERNGVRVVVITAFELNDYR